MHKVLSVKNYNIHQSVHGYKITKTHRFGTFQACNQISLVQNPTLNTKSSYYTPFCENSQRDDPSVDSLQLYHLGQVV